MLSRDVTVIVWAVGRVVIGVGVCSRLQEAVFGRNATGWSSERVECGVGVSVAGSSIASTCAVTWQFVGRRCRSHCRLVSERLGVLSSSQQVRRTKTVSHVQTEMRVSHARGKH